MRVLGVDPGLTRCGIGVIEGQPGRPPRLIAVDVIRTEHDTDLSRRLLVIADAVDELIRVTGPTSSRSSGSSASATCAR